MNNSLQIANDIRTGQLDVNTQELFFPIVIKGLLVNLNSLIYIRNNPVPHLIYHTGDDRMFLETKNYNASIEPLTISNENNVYNIVPRCHVTPGGITLDTAQLTSPYSFGLCQVETEDGVYTMRGEFRRMPVKIAVDLKYLIDSYTDTMELIQYVTTNLAFVRTYNIIYMGQQITCSYKLPDSFSEEHTMDIDGAMSDSRNHTLTLSLEIETNLPIYSNKTMVPADVIISDVKTIVKPV